MNTNNTNNSNPNGAGRLQQTRSRSPTLTLTLQHEYFICAPNLLIVLPPPSPLVYKFTCLNAFSSPGSYSSLRHFYAQWCYHSLLLITYSLPNKQFWDDHIRSWFSAPSRCKGREPVWSYEVNGRLKYCVTWHSLKDSCLAIPRRK